VIRDGLTRREVLSRNDGRNDGGARRDGTTPGARPMRPEHLADGRETIPPVTAAPGYDPALDGAPTAEVIVAAPKLSVLSRLDARTRSMLTAAAVAAVLVNAGAVWAYWHITGSETGRAYAGTVVELNLRGRSDLNKPLTPGSTGNLTVTVTNDHDFPIRITSLARGTGNAVADDEHRENGCVNPGVVVAREVVAVRWNVARNNVGAFTVPDGLTMTAPSDPACAGAVFTIPVLVRGVAGVSSGQ
jgi:hypothetical protein